MTAQTELPHLHKDGLIVEVAIAVEAPDVWRLLLPLGLLLPHDCSRQTRTVQKLI